jgi:two-component system copper resistance phosphate regulon response regulator CusR
MKILIIEDEARTADYLQRGLAENACSSDIAHNGIAGLNMALNKDYDVIILDVMLPGLNGLDVLRELRKKKDVPIIMLTARDLIEDRVRGLQEGADDYLVKPFSFLELMARLWALNRRKRGQERMELQVGDLRLDLLGHKASRGGRRIDLTAKEFTLLAALARHEGQILSKTTIAAMVWGINFDSNTNVVEVAIKRLRAKVDAPYSERLLHTIRGMGYVLERRTEQAGADDPA